MAAVEDSSDKGSWWQRSTIANLVAASVVLGMLFYAVQNKDVEIMKAVGYTAAGYLFGKSVK